jgi:hypothetical protein
VKNWLDKTVARYIYKITYRRCLKEWDKACKVEKILENADMNEAKKEQFLKTVQEQKQNIINNMEQIHKGVTDNG